MSNQIDKSENKNKFWTISTVLEKCGSNATTISKICQSALAQKKVSRGDDLIETIVKLFDYFSYFNSIGVDDTVLVMNSIKSLEEVMIPNEFKSFITPRSVRMIAGNRRLPDLLEHQPVTTVLVDKFDYSEYVQLIDKFRSYFKKDGFSDSVSLDSIKKELALMDVLSIASVSGYVNYDSEPYYPIFLSQNAFYVLGDTFMQDEVEVMISDFCAKIRF